MQQTSRGQRMLESARLAYFWGLVPIALRGKVPLNNNWPNIDAETSLAQFEQMVAGLSIQQQNVLNVGVLTGAKSGVVVVDIDPKNDGLKNWRQLIESNSIVTENLTVINDNASILPCTLTVISGSGGLHYYFRYRSDLPKVPGPKTGIELQSDGGQIVFPQSQHPTTGEPYLFKDGYDYDAANEIWLPTIAEMPQWLVQYFQQILLKRNVLR